MNKPNPKTELQNWRSLIKPYQTPNTRKAVIQLINTFLPFIGIWILMYFSIDWSYWITLGLGVINAFFLVRIFIIQHDCGHQSFLKSRQVNNLIGYLASFFSTIPFTYWSRTHSAHHAHNGQLDHRGLGDIYYLTTEEYAAKTWWGKVLYRGYRNPVFQFVLVPIIYLGFSLRYPFMRLKGWKKIRWSYFLNNISVAVLYVGLAWLLGWQKFLLVHIPVVFGFGIIAFWFFYVQHQHEKNYKAWKDQWDHLLASIQGSTYYRLPKVFQWLSGNIGFHHIHHLNSRIPNYNLPTCARENPVLNRYVPTLTFRESIKCINHKLWDEEKERMISFREYRRKNGKRLR